MTDRKDLIARLWGLLPSPAECEDAAAMLEADARAIRSIVKLFDGMTLECSEPAEVINAAIEKVRG